jgi:sulfopyruvate decarboxylase TPP-binding subunit
MADVLARLSISHVIWVPDSVLGTWEAALETCRDLQLVRVCREGEAWPLAAGLMLGGGLPIVMMQSTGLFESGDALRNVVFDLKLPVFGLIGVRNQLNADTTDSAALRAEPILQAWLLDYVKIERPEEKPNLEHHYRRCRLIGCAGAVLLAE